MIHNGQNNAQSERESEHPSPAALARSWDIFDDDPSNAEILTRQPLPRRISLLTPQSPSRNSHSTTSKRVSISRAESEVNHESYSTEATQKFQLYNEPLHLPNTDRIAESISTTPRSVGGIGPVPSTRLHRVRSKLLGRISHIFPRSFTVTQKRVFKCALAYFLGSLFTYVSPLSDFLVDVTSDSDVPSPIGHLVATIAVYYNPAKTWGAMVEADTFCLIGTVYAAFASLSSMALYWVLEVEPGWEWLGDLLAVGWVAVCMTIVAWLKIWMAKPSFSTACSMISIIIFIVVVKEGGLETFLQICFIVLLGASISNVVCFALWPETATTMLRKDIIKTLISYSTLLDVLTNMFVLESGDQYTPQQLQQAVADHQSSFTSLKKNLGESKSEWALSRQSLQAYDDAVTSLNRLAQHIGGMRGGLALQAEYLKAYEIADSGSEYILNEGDTGVSPKAQAILNEATDKFGEVVGALGGPVQALSHACATSLRQATESLQNTGKWGLGDANSELNHALRAFESTSNHGIVRLYRQSQMLRRNWSSETVNSCFTSLDEQEEIFFIVYFFVFTLREFAEELKHLINALTRVYIHEQTNRLHLWHRWWRSISRRFSRQFSPQFNGPRRSRSFASRLDVREVKRDIKAFLSIRPTAPDRAKLPPLSSLSWWGATKQLCWVLGKHLSAPDKLYAIKTGFGTAILAAPGFFDATRPIFVEYRGEWALITFFVVMNPTIGGTNFLALHRIGGTLLGAFVATTAYTLFHENPLILSICGAIFSMPCFWLIVTKPQYATSGRFILLTYNLTCLFAYNMRHLTIPIAILALRRIAAVVCGILWALIVSHFWWPSLARKEFSKTLSELVSKFGWFYTRLVASHSSPPTELVTKRPVDFDESQNETTPLITAESKTEIESRVEQFQAMELHLQLQLIKLQTLLTQASREPRPKGPFPVVLYKSILASLQAVLDRLHSMRCVTTNPDWYSFVSPSVMQILRRERREMVGNILLYFSTLSSAFQLKTPMPPYLPPAEESRRRLIRAVRETEAMTSGQLNTSGQLLYFAYVLTMKTVVRELEQIGCALQEAYGVIGGSTDNFERLFNRMYEAV